jgi:hypothetical protein
LTALEAVEVEDDEPERPVALAQALGLLGEPRLERALVQQAGEPVAVRLADQLGLARGLVRAVVDRDELSGRAVRQRARRDRHRRPPPTAGGVGERHVERTAARRRPCDPRRRRAPDERAVGTAGHAVRRTVGDDDLAAADDEHPVVEAVERGREHARIGDRRDRRHAPTR